jgi:hypothetical protein
VAVALVALLLSGLVLPSRADALTPGFDSSYAGESAFLTLQQGATGPFTVFFMNTGQTAWRKGTPTQVNLTVCLENKTSCNVRSPHADWNDGTWLSDRAYATHTQVEVAPGAIGTFTYRVRAPLTAPGDATYRFNGDLALSSGEQLHPEGYYHEVSIPRTTGN